MQFNSVHRNLNKSYFDGNFHKFVAGIVVAAALVVVALLNLLEIRIQKG